VKWAKKVAALGTLAVWALAFNHCALELILNLEFLACAPQAETTSHQPGDCGDDRDACATVESGLFKVEENQVFAAKASASTAFFALAFLSHLIAPESSVGQQVPPGRAPPELARGWQFSLRTALPPRAPSFCS
jgi:hypothetical protein